MHSTMTAVPAPRDGSSGGHGQFAAKPLSPISSMDAWEASMGRVEVGGHSGRAGAPGPGGCMHAMENHGDRRRQRPSRWPQAIAMAIPRH